jgi:uncharacterized protein (TIGR03083 family)
MLTQMYLAQQERIINMIETAGGDAEVAACPGWSTGDVIRHLTGLAEDWITHDLEVYASSEWTERQVNRHRDEPLGDVIDQWRTVGATLASYLDDMGNHGLPELIPTVIGSLPVTGFGPGILIDLTQHLHDIAEAVDATPDDGEIIPLCNSMLSRGAHAAVKRADAAAIRLSTTQSGEIATIGKGEPAHHLTADQAALFRCMGGRRSVEEMSQMDWTPSAPDDLTLLVSPFFRAPESSAG